MSPQSKPVKQAFAIAASKQAQEEGQAVAGQHPGFKRVQARIAQRTNPRTGEPYGEERAGAILAAASRGASKGAKRRNPRLKRV